ncbi:uncharacterized protein LOC105688424 [Athalia rosae]|uniref:uncharacterized protein LOC105688424 n=1 Tax=Athalia rosae TaxID=37344 RepID=UPI000626B123|nr:uncharacterized protein LOC105688424 [Athalia rosae]
MSCCCFSDAEPTPGKLEFSKVCSSGFEKERRSIYYSDDVSGRSPCERALSDSSIQSEDSDRQDSEEDIGDMVFVDGNEADLDECEDEDTLMERVWWLAKPPYVPRQTSVVSARRIQVIKERLSTSLKSLPKIRTLKEQRSKGLRNRGSKTQEYIVIGNFAANNQVVCGAGEQTTIPVCAQKLSDILLSCQNN